MTPRHLVHLPLAITLAAAVAIPAAAQDGPGADETATDGDAGGEASEGAGDGGEAAAPENEQAPPDLEALRRDYLELRDRLFQSRARAATVASALYSTEIRIHLDYDSGRFYTIDRAVIRLDGASVFEDTEGRIASDRAPRFEGYVAPGPHEITVRIEAAAVDDARFETSTEHTFTVAAPRGKRVIVRASASDDGDIGYEWSTSKTGSYKLHLDVDVTAEDRPDATTTDGKS